MVEGRGIEMIYRSNVLSLDKQRGYQNELFVFDLVICFV